MVLRWRQNVGRKQDCYKMKKTTGKEYLEAFKKELEFMRKRNEKLPRCNNVNNYYLSSHKIVLLLENLFENKRNIIVINREKFS